MQMKTRIDTFINLHHYSRYLESPGRPPGPATGQWRPCNHWIQPYAEGWIRPINEHVVIIRQTIMPKMQKSRQITNIQFGKAKRETCQHSSHSIHRYIPITHLVHGFHAAPPIQQQPSSDCVALEYTSMQWSGSALCRQIRHQQITDWSHRTHVIKLYLDS